MRKLDCSVGEKPYPHGETDKLCIQGIEQFEYSGANDCIQVMCEGKKRKRDKNTHARILNRRKGGESYDSYKYVFKFRVPFKPQ